MAVETNSQEMEEKKKMVLAMCVCPDCPSWQECGEDGGYCFPSIGKSTCITEQNGCICGGCPVTRKLELKNIYFCTDGSEMEQNLTSGG
jgi:hypothetical protein